MSRFQIPLVALFSTLFWVTLPASFGMAQIIQLEPSIGEPSTPRQRPEAPQQDGGSSIPSERGRTDSRPISLSQGDEIGTMLVPLRPERLRSNYRAAVRLTGEAATERFILYLPHAQGATELQLAHQTGIDALPERSSLSVIVNGTELGQITPSNFNAFSTDSLPVPEGVLRPGRNIVEIRTRHTHRIACGPEASFALWTDINARSSGVHIGADTFGVGPVSFMAAIAAQTALGAPVTFRRPDPDLPMLDAAPFIAQAAIGLGGTLPEIVSAPYWTMEAETPELARITAFPEGEGPSEPKFLRGGDGASVLFLDMAQDYSQIISELFSEDDLTMSSGPALLAPGKAQPLSGLGIARQQGQGRYIMLPVEFALPWDWVLLASQKAQLDLDYRFAAGLPEGALLLVKVNGTTVRLLPLDRDGGQALPTLPITFGARLLQPGINRLEFEALIPGAPPDAACPPMDGPMLEISEESQIFVPAAPSMSLPSIDMSLALISTQDIVLTSSAQAMLPAGLAPQIAAALMKGQEHAPPRGTTPRFNIGTLADAEQLQTPLLRDAFDKLHDALGANAAQSGSEQASSQAWGTVSGRRGIHAWLGLEEIGELPRRLVTAVGQLAYGATPTLEDWLEGRAAQAAILQPDLDAPDEIWLIFSPHADPSVVVRALAASRVSRDRPEGQVSLYNEDSGWESWTAPDRPLTLYEGLGAGNMRAVMGNYATMLPVPFVSIVLGLTLFSAFVALAILILTRRRGR